MIFTTTPIRSRNVLVRFYHYSDPHKSYGDAGTVRYARIPLTQFECVEDQDVNDQPYWRYELKTEAAVQIFGDRHWWYGIGYERSTATRHRQDLAKAQARAEQLSTIAKL